MKTIKRFLKSFWLLVLTFAIAIIVSSIAGLYIIGAVLTIPVYWINGKGLLNIIDNGLKKGKI